MFHSHANKELELFAKWRNDLADIEFHLVRKQSRYPQKNMARRNRASLCMKLP